MNIVQRLVLIVLLAAIPVGVLQGFSLRSQYRHEREEIAQAALQAAQRAAAEQGRVIDGARQLLAGLAQLPAVQMGDANGCSIILKRLNAQFPAYLGIGVSDPRGRIWCSSIVRGTDISDRAYFQRAVATRTFTTGGYVIGRVSGQASLNFSMPFEDASGELRGVLVAGLNLDQVARDLARAQLPTDTRLLVAGPDRRVLVDLPGNARRGALLPPSLLPAFEARQAGTSEARWLDGSARLTGFVPPAVEPGGGFLIAAGIDRNRALSAVSKRGVENLATLLLTVAVALLLAWWFATRFVRLPVRRLAATVHAWREGDAAARVGRLGSGGSEFDDLGQAFDDMAEAVDERQRRLRDALESTTDSVLTLSPDWIVTFLNGRAQSRLRGAELLGKNILEAFPDFANERASMVLRTAMEQRTPARVELDYDPLPARFEVNAFPTPDGGLTLFMRDVTEQHRAREELRYLALHDPLTGLANRTNAMAVATEKLARGQLSAMILIDLDGFKHVNDSFGHLSGDEVLAKVAQRLAFCIDDDAMIARLGGDEFLVLLFQTPVERCVEIGDLLVEELGREPFLVRNRCHSVTASCGVVLVADGLGEHVGDLLANADLALYAAKEAGGGICRSYSAADRDAYETRRLLEEEVARAVTAREFELYFQPQVRLRDGAWIGAEALLRWRHPQRGLLAPGAFIHILEHGRHAQAAGDWVLDEACREAARWWRMGRKLRIGVNLFAEQIRSGDLLGNVQRALARHGLPPEALELELTENIALAHEAGTAGTLTALRMLGVRLAFDDFGTGFASLTTLKKIPVHRLKIDRGFVANLPADEHDKGIVEAILALARTLDLEVIAEGVETAAQEEYLRSRGCAEAQGYRYARPMPAAAFRASILEVPCAARAG
jgi:diguanylate cyclase (GGDEF)-like protein